MPQSVPVPTTWLQGFPLLLGVCLLLLMAGIQVWMTLSMNLKLESVKAATTHESMDRRHRHELEQARTQAAETRKREAYAAILEKLLRQQMTIAIYAMRRPPTQDETQNAMEASNTANSTVLLQSLWIPAHCRKRALEVNHAGLSLLSEMSSADPATRMVAFKPQLTTWGETLEALVVEFQEDLKTSAAPQNAAAR